MENVSVLPVRDKVDGPGSKKTVLGQNDRFIRVELDGSNHRVCHTVCVFYQTGKLKTLEVDGLRKKSVNWTVF